MQGFLARVKAGAMAAGMVATLGVAMIVPSAGAQTLPKGGTVVMALPPLTSINWFQPIRPVAYNSLYDAWVSNMMYKGLYRVNSKGQVDYPSSIASAITWNKTGTVYTVKMNPKWHWSNGTPVTAQDVIFEWNLIVAASSPNAPAPWPWVGAGPYSLVSLAKSVKAVGKYEVVVTLNNPVNQLWFLINSLGSLQPLPAAAWNKYPKNVNQELTYIAQNGNNPSFFNVVDGAFKLSSVVANGSWTMVPNTRYNGHKANISRFVLAYQTSAQAEVNALQTGQVQIGYLPPNMYLSRHNFTLDHLVITYGQTIARGPLNYLNPQVGSILKQQAVRAALQLGVDQQTIINALYYGNGKIGITDAPYTSPFIDPALKKSQPYSFNTQKGIQILEKAGWHKVNGVMTNSKGQQLKFDVQFPTGNPTTQAMAELLQQGWAQEGIIVTLSPTTFPAMLQFHQQPSKWQIQVGLGLSGLGYPVGVGIYATGGGGNFYGYSSKQMDALVTATVAPHATPKAAQTALNAYQVFVANQLPNLWMPAAAGLNEVSYKVLGYPQFVNTFSSMIYPQYLAVRP